MRTIAGASATSALESLGEGSAEDAIRHPSQLACLGLTRGCQE